MCDPPQSWTILGGQPALLLRCARRIGGWPQVAIVASVDHTAWLADGILPTLPVMERSIGVLSGRVPLPEAPARPPSPTMSRLIDRLAARAFSAGDVAEYTELMSLGVRANQAEDFVFAETAYRAALALQQKVLGQKNPNTASALMNVALQLSDEGRRGDADAVFDRSAGLVPAAADQSAAPRLVHYRALSRINRKQYADALSLLDEAERGYAKLVPPETLTARPRRRLPGVSAGAETIPNERVLTDPVVQSALMGLIKVRRYRAIALRELQQPDEATAAMRSAEDLATANGMVQPLIAARVSRTAAVTDPTALIMCVPLPGGCRVCR